MGMARDAANAKANAKAIQADIGELSGRHQAMPAMLMYLMTR